MNQRVYKTACEKTHINISNCIDFISSNTLISKIYNHDMTPIRPMEHPAHHHKKRDNWESWNFTPLSKTLQRWHLPSFMKFEQVVTKIPDPKSRRVFFWPPDSIRLTSHLTINNHSYSTLHNYENSKTKDIEISFCLKYLRFCIN